MGGAAAHQEEDDGGSTGSGKKAWAEVGEGDLGIHGVHAGKMTSWTVDLACPWPLRLWICVRSKRNMCRIFMKTQEGLGKTGGDEFVVDVHPAGGEVDDQDDGLEVSLLDSFGEDEEEEVAQLIDIIA